MSQALALLFFMTPRCGRGQEVSSIIVENTFRNACTPPPGQNAVSSASILQTLYGDGPRPVSGLFCACWIDELAIDCGNYRDTVSYSGFDVIRSQTWVFRMGDILNPDFDMLVTWFECTDESNESLNSCNAFVDHLVAVDYNDNGQPTGCRVLDWDGWTLGNPQVCTTCELCGADGVIYDCFEGQATSDGCQAGFQYNPFVHDGNERTNDSDNNRQSTEDNNNNNNLQQADETVETASGNVGGRFSGSIIWLATIVGALLVAFPSYKLV